MAEKPPNLTPSLQQSDKMHLPTILLGLTGLLTFTSACGIGSRVAARCDPEDPKCCAKVSTLCTPDSIVASRCDPADPKCCARATFEKRCAVEDKLRVRCEYVYLSPTSLSPKQIPSLAFLFSQKMHLLFSHSSA